MVKLRGIYRFHIIVRVAKSRIVWWTGHVVYMEKENEQTYRILLEK